MKICFVYSNRAEESILLPFIEYFKKKMDISILNLKKSITEIEKDEKLADVYNLCLKKFKKNRFQYICILGDRREIPFVTLAAMFTNTSIIHIASGEHVESTSTYDQYLRPIISLKSSIQICFSKIAKNEIDKLFDGIDYLRSNSHVVGNPVFKNIKVNNLKQKFKEKYDLVLLHPQSLSAKETKKDISFVKKQLKNKKVIFISGNKDNNYKIIENFYNEYRSNKNNIFYENLPKIDYFGLVKYCDKFYTNSSSISEIKFLNKKCLISIGLRNKNRSESKLDANAPEKLLNILKKYQKKVL